MKAILLAAGVGSRISKENGNIPKSLMLVNGRPMLQHTVELLLRNGMDVVVITGFQHRLLEDVLKTYPVKTVYNPFFAVTNSIGSLWMAREEFCTEEIFLANADVYYTQELLDRIRTAPYDQFLLSDDTRADQGDYFLLSENGILRKYGKELTRSERNCEYVGIAVVRNRWVRKFHTRLCEMIEAGQYNLWWENVLYSLVDEDEIRTFDVSGIFWSEVDTMEDYRRVLDYCESHPGA